MCLGDRGQTCKWLSLMVLSIMLGLWLGLKGHAGSCDFVQVGCHATCWSSLADSIRVLPVGPWTMVLLLALFLSVYLAVLGSLWLRPLL